MDDSERPFVDSEGNLADEDDLWRQARASVWIGLASLLIPPAGPFGFYLGSRVLDYDLPIAGRLARIGRGLSLVGTGLLVVGIVAFAVWITRELPYGFSIRFGF